MFSSEIEVFESLKLNPNTITSIISAPANDDWFISEILTRLPVKSLFRFKIVCKRWGSLIQTDQNFVDLHLLNHSKTSLRRLLIVNPVPKKAGRVNNKCDDDHDENFLIRSWPYEEIHITADLKLFQDEKGDTTTATNVVVVDTLREVDSSYYNIITNPVNGLICLIESDFLYVIRICNISTGELSPWFESSLLSREDIDGIPYYRMHYGNPRPYYQLGFDPYTNEHKLVCVWEVSSVDRQSQYLICDVLTVGRQGIHGDNRWRRIKEVPDVPPYHGLGEDSVYVNGVIYWSTLDLTLGAWKSENRPIFVVAFDVGREKFRKIIVPDFILDQPPRPYQGDDNPLDSPSYYYPLCDFVNLLEVGGCLALLVQMNNCLFKMYIYEDDDYKLEDEINKTPTCSGVGFSSNKNGRWTEAGSITLPFNLGKKGGVRFCKFVGSDDEIVLASSEGQNCDEEAGTKKCVSFYSCNWKKGSWREFEVSGIPSSIPHLCTGSYVTTFSESLLPINNDKALF